MSKEVKFTTVIGHPYDIRAEFWMRDTQIESKWLTADEEDGLMEHVDFDLVRNGTTVSMNAEDIQDLINDGSIGFLNDDGDWTNFEMILSELLEAEE